MEKNPKYICILKIITLKLLEICLPDETVKEISSVILQILDKNCNSDDAVVLYFIFTIFVIIRKSNVNLECNVLIKELIDGNDKKFNNESNIQEQLRNIVNHGKNNCFGKNIFIKEYKEVVLDSIKSHSSNSMKKPTFNKANKNSQKIFYNTLQKYEEFKNSLKQLYNLEGTTLSVDKKIINYIEKENTNNNNNNNSDFSKNRLQSLQSCEKFFLETSIEMFNEIFEIK
jgi:hypothetical protein